MEEAEKACLIRLSLETASWVNSSKKMENGNRQMNSHRFKVASQTES